MHDICITHNLDTIISGFEKYEKLNMAVWMWRYIKYNIENEFYSIKLCRIDVSHYPLQVMISKLWSPYKFKMAASRHLGFEDTLNKRQKWIIWPQIMLNECIALIRATFSSPTIQRYAILLIYLNSRCRPATIVYLTIIAMNIFAILTNDWNNPTVSIHDKYMF